MLKTLTEEQALAGSGSQLSAAELAKLLNAWEKDTIITPATTMDFLVHDVRKTHDSAKDMEQEERDALRKVVVNTLTGLVKSGICTKEIGGEKRRGKYKRVKMTNSKKRRR